MNKANQVHLSIHLEKFTNHLKSLNRSTSTLLAYHKDIDQLIQFVATRNKTLPHQVTATDISDFMESLRQNGYTNKSISRKTNSTKTFFRHLTTQGAIQINPAQSIIHPKYETKPPRILTKMEYRALRDTARHDTRISAIIELLLQTGIRIGELSRIKLEDIREDKLTINAHESHTTRVIPLNKPARHAVELYLNQRPDSDDPHLFITKTGRPLLVRNIRTSIDRYFRLAGIKNAKVNDLRHTWIAHQLKSGASAVLVSKLAGHKRLSTTEKYLKIIENQTNREPKLEEL